MSVVFLLILIGIYTKAGAAYWICLMSAIANIYVTIAFAFPKKDNMI